MLPTSSDNRHMDAERFTMTSVHLHQTARCHVTEDGKVYWIYRAPYGGKPSSLASHG